MKNENQKGENKTDAKKVVLEFLEALNAEDYEKAEKYLDNEVKFIGVMGKRDGAETYISDMKKMKFKYDIKKVLYDETDVSVFYNITMDGKPIFCSGWYQIKNNLIFLIEVVFDPRPLLKK